MRGFWGTLLIVPLALGGMAAGSHPAMATACDTVAGNLVTNCGFEGGTTSSTIGGNTNSSVPAGWTANAGYDLEPGFNHLQTNPHSGSFALSIGNDNGQLVPALSQVLTDTAGQTYNASFFIQYGGFGTTDPTPFFNAQINGVNEVSLNGQTGPQSYTEEDFTFVGTGSDTLGFMGNTNPSEWYVDDFVVVAAGPTPTPVPEPAPLALFASAVAALGLVRRRKSA